MRVTFHGAARTVTGSKHLLELDNGFRVLLDCGMFQGLGEDTLRLNAHFGFDPATVDAVILSHAHIDHTGLLPRLVKEGFKGPVYSTRATTDLCQIMLMDSAYIQEADAYYVNKRKRLHGKQMIEPLYDADDVEATMRLFRPMDYNESFHVAKGLEAEFTQNGHILGSAVVNLRIREEGMFTRLAFTGDIGRYGSPLLQDPHTFPQADIIISESTYGNRTHDSHESGAQAIMEAIRHTCGEKRGKLIIPAFSLGRIQELVYTINKLDLHGLLPDVKIYVDSPLAVNATEISRRYVDEMNPDVQDFAETGRPDPFGFSDLHYIRQKEESKALNLIKDPCIIISSSGMAEAGRVKHHLKNNLDNPANSVLLVGYAHPKSLAGKLKSGARQVSIYGELVDVEAEVFHVDAWSAHADRDEMIRFMSCQDRNQVERIFLVHGEDEAQEAYKISLEHAGFGNVVIPEFGETFEL
jgi:metallo-beta-lactamase family protein